MNLQEICTDLTRRALALESQAEAMFSEAQKIRQSAYDISGMLFGTAPEPPKAQDPEANKTARQQAMAVGYMETYGGEVAPKKAPKAPVQPSVADIRAKAAEFGVGVEDLLPPKKKPTNDQKRQALLRIVEAKREQKGTIDSQDGVVEEVTQAASDGVTQAVATLSGD